MANKLNAIWQADVLPFCKAALVNRYPFDSGSVVTTEYAALKRREALISADPALRGTLQVVPVFEMSV